MSVEGTGKYSGEETLQRSFLKADEALRLMLKYQSYVTHPWGRGSLTTNGVQWSGVTTGSTASTAVWKVVSTMATIQPPAGLSAIDMIDEMEFGLTGRIRTAATASTLGSSAVHYKWQAKNNDETTWTDISTARILGTTGYAERTLSGRYQPATGLNVLPFNVRLVILNKKIGKGRAQIKNSSYVLVQSKTSTTH